MNVDIIEEAIPAQVRHLMTSEYWLSLTEHWVTENFWYYSVSAVMFHTLLRLSTGFASIAEIICVRDTLLSKVTRPVKDSLLIIRCA